LTRVPTQPRLWLRQLVGSGFGEVERREEAPAAISSGAVDTRRKLPAVRPAVHQAELGQSLRVITWLTKLPSPGRSGMPGTWPGPPVISSAWSDVVRSCGERDADRDSSQRQEGTRTPKKHVHPVQRPERSRWRYLPLTRTRSKQLTCCFATPRLTNLYVGLRPSAKHPGSLRHRLDERDIVGLITAHRDDTTAASLAADYG